MHEIPITLCRMYEIILLTRVLCSWIPVSQENPVVMWLYRLTDPVLVPLRRILPWKNLPVDLSPVLLFVALLIVQTVLRRIL